MSAEVLTTIATGLAILGFGWRMYANLDRKIDGLRNDVNKDLNDVRKDLSGINGRLSAVEGKLELLVQGLHIEISGRGQA